MFNSKFSLTKIDEHGRVEYKPSVSLTFDIINLLVVILFGAIGLYIFEVGEGNIQNFEDCIWTTFMIITTIGFGDHFPLTIEGRIISLIVFVRGVIVYSSLFDSVKRLNKDKRESNVSNRQLYTVLAELLRINQQSDTHTIVDKNSHSLDNVYYQERYESPLLEKGWITAGRDSGGLYVVSINALCKKTGNIFNKWIPTDKDTQRELFDRLSKEGVDC